MLINLEVNDITHIQQNETAGSSRLNSPITEIDETNEIVIITHALPDSNDEAVSPSDSNTTRLRTSNQMEPNAVLNLVDDEEVKVLDMSDSGIVIIDDDDDDEVEVLESETIIRDQEVEVLYISDSDTSMTEENDQNDKANSDPTKHSGSSNKEEKDEKEQISRGVLESSNQDFENNTEDSRKVTLSSESEDNFLRSFSIERRGVKRRTLEQSSETLGEEDKTLSSRKSKTSKRFSSCKSSDINSSEETTGPEKDPEAVGQQHFDSTEVMPEDIDESKSRTHQGNASNNKLVKDLSKFFDFSDEPDIQYHKDLHQSQADTLTEKVKKPQEKFNMTGKTFRRREAVVLCEKITRESLSALSVLKVLEDDLLILDKAFETTKASISSVKNDATNTKEGSGDPIAEQNEFETVKYSNKTPNTLQNDKSMRGEAVIICEKLTRESLSNLKDLQVVEHHLLILGDSESESPLVKKSDALNRCSSENPEIEELIKSGTESGEPNENSPKMLSDGNGKTDQELSREEQQLVEEREIGAFSGLQKSKRNNTSPNSSENSDDKTFPVEKNGLKEDPKSTSNVENKKDESDKCLSSDSGSDIDSDNEDSAQISLLDILKMKHRKPRKPVKQVESEKKSDIDDSEKNNSPPITIIEKKSTNSMVKKRKKYESDSDTCSDEESREDVNSNRKSKKKDVEKSERKDLDNVLEKVSDTLSFNKGLKLNKGKRRKGDPKPEKLSSNSKSAQTFKLLNTKERTIFDIDEEIEEREERLNAKRRSLDLPLLSNFDVSYFAPSPRISPLVWRPPPFPEPSSDLKELSAGPVDSFGEINNSSNFIGDTNNKDSANGPAPSSPRAKEKESVIKNQLNPEEIENGNLLETPEQEQGQSNTTELQSAQGDNESNADPTSRKPDLCSSIVGMNTESDLKNYQIQNQGNTISKETQGQNIANDVSEGNLSSKLQEVQEKDTIDSKMACGPQEKVYCPVFGSLCHQCQLKTLDTKTICRSGQCSDGRGQFCGVCLKSFYGEDGKAALKNPDWHCPPCRGICKCVSCSTAGKSGLEDFVIPNGVSSFKTFLESFFQK